MMVILVGKLTENMWLETEEDLLLCKERNSFQQMEYYMGFALGHIIHKKYESSENYLRKALIVLRETHVDDLNKPFTKE